MGSILFVLAMLSSVCEVQNALAITFAGYCFMMLLESNVFVSEIVDGWCKTVPI